MLTAVDAYRTATSNLTRSLDIVSKSPQVARETKHYLDNITKVKSVDDLMGDKRLLRYALTAHGLGDMAFAGAFIRKVLEGGIDNTDALANRLADQRYRDFVTTFNFVRYGSATVSFDRAQTGTTASYVRQRFEENTGEQNEGARLALYFQRKVEKIASPLNILADAALLKVAQTSLGLPATMSNLSIDSQVQMIAAKLDVADLKDPAKLNRFLERFTALWDLNNPTAAASNAVVPSLGSSTSGFGPDLITAIQNLKKRF